MPTQMTEQLFYKYCIIGFYIAAALTFALVINLPAPYGRHYKGNWGPSMSNRWGWFLMESPAIWAFLIIYSMGQNSADTVALTFLGIWLVHYTHRSLIFPFRISNKNKRMPLLIVALGFLFNIFNAYVTARWVSHFGDYDIGWLESPHFLLGLSMFVAGLYLNIRSDNILFALRKRKKGGYGIPYAGPFIRLSCPNYLGEIIEWMGWALLTWSSAGTAFALFAAANLVPRAIAHHQWYRSKFTDYPADRKILIPGIF